MNEDTKYTKEQQDEALRMLHHMALASKGFKGTDEELYTEISNLREQLLCAIYRRGLFAK